LITFCFCARRLRIDLDALSRQFLHAIAHVLVDSLPQDCGGASCCNADYQRAQLWQILPASASASTAIMVRPRQRRLRPVGDLEFVEVPMETDFDVIARTLSLPQIHNRINLTPGSVNEISPRYQLLLAPGENLAS